MVKRPDIIVSDPTFCDLKTKIHGSTKISTIFLNLAEFKAIHITSGIHSPKSAVKIT